MQVEEGLCQLAQAASQQALLASTATGSSLRAALQVAADLQATVAAQRAAASAAAAAPRVLQAAGRAAEVASLQGLVEALQNLPGSLTDPIPGVSPLSCVASPGPSERTCVAVCCCIV